MDRRQFFAIAAGGLGALVAPSAAARRLTFPAVDWAAGDPAPAERAEALRAVLRAGDTTGSW